MSLDISQYDMVTTLRWKDAQKLTTAQRFGNHGIVELKVVGSNESRYGNPLQCALSHRRHFTLILLRCTCRPKILVADVVRLRPENHLRPNKYKGNEKHLMREQQSREYVGRIINFKLATEMVQVWNP